MSNFVYATGEEFNSFERMVSPLTVTNEDAELVRARLYDRDLGLAYRVGSVVANHAITGDLNILPNGDMEIDGGAGLPPASWSEVLSGAGDVTRGTGAGEFDTGSAGLKLTVGGSGTAEAYQEKYCRAGERIVLKARAKDAGAGTIKARLRNMRTGKWATSGGAWSASSADFATYDVTSWGDFFTQYTIVVEDFLTCGADRAKLRLSFVNDTVSTSKFVDNVAWWPTSDLLGGFGHAIPPGTLVEWHASIDNFAADDTTFGAALFPSQPTFYWAPVSSGSFSLKRYQRLLAPGTPADTTPWWLSELVLTQGIVVQGIVPTLSEERLYEQLRVEGPTGKARIYPLADKPTRMLTFPVGLYGDPAFVQFRDELMERSQGGRWPCFAIVEDSDAKAAIYGHVPARYRHERTAPTVRKTSLAIVEQPFPTFL